MEPVTIAIICTAIFGVVATLTAFIRQVLFSRDKALNDLAQQRALATEAHELQRLRIQIVSHKRFYSHYQVLGANKDLIAYLDQKIEDIFRKKIDLIQRYADVTLKESVAIILGDKLASRKAMCDSLKRDIDHDIALCDKDIEQLQKRRANLWDCHEKELQHYLLDQEALRNTNLNSIYQKHTGVLEKIYQRHTENSEMIAKYTIDTATLSFKSLMMMPFDLLVSLFKPSTGIVPDAAKKESQSRKTISMIQDDLNEDSYRGCRLMRDNHRMYSPAS